MILERKKYLIPKMSWDNKGLMNAIDDIDDLVMEGYEELICKGTFIICFSASQ